MNVYVCTVVWVFPDFVMHSATCYETWVAFRLNSSTLLSLFVAPVICHHYLRAAVSHLSQFK